MAKAKPQAKAAAKASGAGKAGGGKADDARKPRTSPATFLRQVRQEAGKVTWPSRKETWVASLMVFIMVTLAAIFFFVVDQALAFVVRLILGLGG